MSSPPVKETEEKTKIFTWFPLNRLQLDLHLTCCPTVNIPPQMNHAVLLQPVVIERMRGDEALSMRGLVIYFNRHTPRTIFQYKISIAAILINIMIL